MFPTEWHNPVTARAEWLDAPEEDDGWDVLEHLLDAARAAIEAYGTPRANPESIPAAWRIAQLMQARNIWNASITSPASGEIGEGQFVISPKPLDWQIRQLVRPRRGVPVVA